jgi:hypothetical protein
MELQVQFHNFINLGGDNMIIQIRHYGIAFESNENALLLVSGLYHHIVLIR